MTTLKVYDKGDYSLNTCDDGDSSDIPSKTKSNISQ